MISVTRASQAAEEVWFCHSEAACSAEESLFLMDLDRGEIPRFARNDKKFDFFRSLFSLWRIVRAGTKTQG